MTTERRPSLEDTLRQRLIALGVTQTQIAEATGLSQSSAGRFLRGEVTVRMDTFERLRDYVQDAEAKAQAGLLPPPKLPKAQGIRKGRQQAVGATA